MKNTILKFLLTTTVIAIIATLGGCSTGKSETSNIENQPITQTISKENQLVDIKTIAGKSQAEVTTTLGTPKTIDKWDRSGYVTVEYGDATDQGWARFTILFVDDKAVRITIGLNKAELKVKGSDNLPYIGLPSTISMTQEGLTWQAHDIEGFYIIKVDPNVFQIKIILTKEFESV